MTAVVAVPSAVPRAFWTDRAFLTFAASAEEVGQSIFNHPAHEARLIPCKIALL